MILILELIGNGESHHHGLLSMRAKFRQQRHRYKQMVQAGWLVRAQTIFGFNILETNDDDGIGRISYGPCTTYDFRIIAGQGIHHRHAFLHQRADKGGRCSEVCRRVLLLLHADAAWARGLVTHMITTIDDEITTGRGVHRHQPGTASENHST
jgi:hypothetical protein